MPIAYRLGGRASIGRTFAGAMGDQQCSDGLELHAARALTSERVPKSPHYAPTGLSY